MPISTNSPIRDILWSKLYGPQYQTIDQNNIAVGDDRNRRVGTSDAMMKEAELVAQRRLSEDPTNPVLQQQFEAAKNNQGLSYDDQQAKALTTEASYATGIDAAEQMANPPNLTKAEEFTKTRTAVGGGTLDVLFEKAKGKPSNVGNPNNPANPPAATPPAETNKTVPKKKIKTTQRK